MGTHMTLALVLAAGPALLGGGCRTGPLSPCGDSFVTARVQAEGEAAATLCLPLVHDIEVHYDVDPFGGCHLEGEALSGDDGSNLVGLADTREWLAVAGPFR